MTMRSRPAVRTRDFHCEILDRRLLLAGDPTLAGHWGGESYALAISGSTAYVGQGQDLLVVNIAQPTNPQQIGQLRLPGIVESIAVSGERLYIANDENGLQIVDVTNPANPFAAGSLDTAGNAYGVAVAGNYAYVADWGSGLQVINVSNPAAPVAVARYSTAG